MSNTQVICKYCMKDCKLSDSKPYPSSKSKDRIHFKCQIKKSLNEKKERTSDAESSAHQTMASKSSFDILDRLYEEKRRVEERISNETVDKIIKEQAKQSETRDSTFFFDVKAGIAKPHEKRRYLHHRNLSEIGSRFNDQGFQEESMGRAYDHRGKDLMSLGDDSPEEDNQDVRFRHATSAKRSLRSTEDTERDHKKKRKPTMIKIDEKNPCWFCLSSPNVEKYLIISIGDYCYLSLAKGGLVDEHLLIIPIEHIRSSLSKQNSSDILGELEEFKKSIINYFDDQSQGVVFFERNFRSVHWQIQAVPVPKNKLDDLPAKIKSLSKLHYKPSDYIDIPHSCKVADLIPDNTPYFYWQIEPVGSRFVSQLHVGGKESFFPIHLGRMILAEEEILNQPARVDWKNCVRTFQEYSDLVQVVKEKYKPYDIAD